MAPGPSAGPPPAPCALGAFRPGPRVFGEAALFFRRPGGPGSRSRCCLVLRTLCFVGPATRPGSGPARSPAILCTFGRPGGAHSALGGGGFLASLTSLSSPAPPVPSRPRGRPPPLPTLAPRQVPPEVALSSFATSSPLCLPLCRCRLLFSPSLIIGCILVSRRAIVHVTYPRIPSPPHRRPPRLLLPHIFFLRLQPLGRWRLLVRLSRGVPMALKIGPW